MVVLGAHECPWYLVSVKMTLARRFFKKKDPVGGGSFQTFLDIFIPKIGEDEPILTKIFFKWVGKNHQLVVSGAQKRW